MEQASVALSTVNGSPNTSYSLVSLKGILYDSQSAAKSAIETQQLQLIPPKTLQASSLSIDGRKHGNNCTLSCPCGLVVSIVPKTIKYKLHFIIGKRKGFDENLEHSPHCFESAKPSKKALVSLMNSADLAIDVNTFQEKFAHNGIRCNKAVVYRAKASKRELELGNEEENIRLLPSICKSHVELNVGAYVKFEKDSNNYFLRLSYVSQLAVCLFQCGFIRKFIGIDAGHKYVCVAKKYKLLLAYATTGNNNNICLGWCVADGETKDNYAFLINSMKAAGINLNTGDCVIVSDEGRAIVGAKSEQLPNAHHTFCAMHWIGKYGHGYWGLRNDMYWKFVKAYNTSKLVNEGLKILSSSGCSQKVTLQMTSLMESHNNGSIITGTGLLFRYFREEPDHDEQMDYKN